MSDQKKKQRRKKGKEETKGAKKEKKKSKKPQVQAQPKAVVLKSDEKKRISLAILGCHQSGKSTTTGRLLFDLGSIISDKDFEKLQKTALQLGRESFLYSFILMKSKQERSNFSSINCSMNSFETTSYRYNVIDTPGNRKYVKNMMIGISQADAGLLIVSAIQDEFVQSIKKHDTKTGELEGETRLIARLCHLLGIDQLIVGINKLDDLSVNYDENKFNAIKNEMDKILTKIGFKTKKIPFIPICGFNGDNVYKKSNIMSWWKGFKVKSKGKEIKGVTVFDALENVIKPPKRIKKKPLRLPISNVFHIKSVGNIVTGRIEQGTVKAEDEIQFYPSGCTCKALSLQINKDEVKEAIAGDNIAINIGNMSYDKLPKKGDVMVIKNDENDPSPPNIITKFSAIVVVQAHPGKLRATKSNHNSGFEPLIQVRSGSAPCRMVKIKWKLGKSTNNTKMNDCEYLEVGDQAQVDFVPLKPIVLEEFDNCGPLGRFAVMEQGLLVMLGKITKVDYLNEKHKKKHDSDEKKSSK